MPLIDFVNLLDFEGGRVVFCFPTFSFFLPLSAHCIYFVPSPVLVLMELLIYSLVCLSKKKGQSKSLFK